MYLFILESIGTSELILIGIVALIVFGPRKLPQMAKTVGKMMAEFRTATSEFKTTWQREASFEEEANQLKNIFEDPDLEETSNNIKETPKILETTPVIPEIREVDISEVKKKLEVKEKEAEMSEREGNITDKRDWL